MSKTDLGKNQIPSFTAAQKQGFKDYWAVYEKHYREVSEKLLEELKDVPEIMALVKNVDAAQMEESRHKSMELQRRALIDGDWEPYMANAQTQGAMYGQTGISFKTWFEVVGGYRKYILPHMLEVYSKDPERLIGAIHGMDTYIDIAMSIVGEGYLAAKEKTILQQQVSIHELSTPVLQLKDRLLILPIIGVLDSHRARGVTEQLLHAIRSKRAKVVVIDITGVPTVDSAVANHLIQTVEASRLMGATAIVTGLSAEIAQTLVRIGVNWGKLITVGDLQSGIEEAELILNSSRLADDDTASGPGRVR